MMEQYKGAPLGDLSPHVFAVADCAYRFLEVPMFISIKHISYDAVMFYKSLFCAEL
jgi:hypothetical protein